MADPVRPAPQRARLAFQRIFSPLLTAFDTTRQAYQQRFFNRRWPFTSKVWLSWSALATGLVLLAGLGYTLLVFGLSIILGQVLDPVHPFLLGALVVVLVILLNPLRARVVATIDETLKRRLPDYASRLQSFRQELGQVADLASIVGLLRRYVFEDLDPARLHFYLSDAESGQFTATLDSGGLPTSDLRFQPDSPLVEALSHKESLALDRPDSLPEALKAIRSRLEVLDSALFVPVSGTQTLLGWIALGHSRSGNRYSSVEIRYLEELCGLAAVEIERARALSDLRRQVDSMQALTRVAQGINFTTSFDDILELIYAQINQVIPTQDFRLTLINKDHLTGSPVFWLENDERKTERENQLLDISVILEGEVARSQCALVTVDYDRECRLRGFRPEFQGIYAWVGVPVHAGAEMIGVFSLGSRTPSTAFHEEQRDLFQAIADQAGGAILKARLLQEVEQRAHQLATLNEIGRNLTSTLDSRILRQQILHSAIDLLNAEAGVLFLVDESSSELVCEVASERVSSPSLGARYPVGTGPAGEAVLKRHAVIANAAIRSHEDRPEFKLEDNADSLDRLAAPMLLQDRTIGVIEVINSAGGLPFSVADQELLASFASQASIAIENARLYTLTDQALSDRVAELSDLQNIDRVLNASLDLDRTLQITLEWAMRKSGASAGLIAIFEAGRLRVKTHQGYQGEQAAIEGMEAGNPPGPGRLQSIQAALKTRQPQLRDINNSEGESAGSSLPDGLLASAVRQAVIPILRDVKILAVMVLECDRQDACLQDAIDLITRFCDHAAIAIANAQLYAEVTEANLAKSKFVSFVAHELKNPMASIKGYTELVAGGMAGPVTTLQASFLATVRANVDRMNTIVSDLNDLTKIQVGSLRLEFRSISVKELLDEVTREMGRLVADKGLRLAVDIPENLPRVWGDPTRLSQILTNLLSNAQKYTQEGGEIHIGCELSDNGTHQSPGVKSIHIWIRDSGIGIPSQDQEKIFQPYFRTEISKEVATGAGLGLNITRSLVEMQAGEVWFESELGAGTTFHFTIPVAEDL